MMQIVQNWIFDSASKFVLIFVLAPAGIIFAANLIYIAAEITKELRGGKRR